MAAGVGSACGDGGLTAGEIGTVKVTITGLGTGLADGGHALISNPTDPAFVTLDLTVPAPVGAQPTVNITTDVPAGTYHVVYTPPSGYLVSGANAFDTLIEDGIITNVDVTVTLIVVNTQGTLRITVTGIQAGATSGGSAQVVIGGGTPLTVPIPGAGTVDTVVIAGSYQVTYTAPTGYGISAGVINPRTVNVSVGATATATFAVTLTPTGFPTPDLTNNASFEGGYDGLVNGSGSTPTGFALDNAHAKDGVLAIKRVLAKSGWTVTSFTNASPTVVFAPGSNLNDGNQIGMAATSDNSLNSDYYNNNRFAKRVDADHFQVFTNAALSTPLASPGGTGGFVTRGDAGPHLARAFGNGAGVNCVDRLWTRYYFYFDGIPSSPFKFNIYEDSTSYSAQWGGMYVFGFGGVMRLAWLFSETSALTALVDLGSILNGWHSFEVDYWLNGDTSNGGVDRPSAAFWFDDVAVTTQLGGLPANHAWINTGGTMRLNAGTRGSRGGTGKIGTSNWLGVLNRNNLNACNVWLDRVSVSRLGRIGP